MRKINILIAILLTGAVGCSDFLDEQSKETNYGLFEDAQGIEYLVNGAYGFLRYKHGGEQAFTLWEYGVDTYTAAADGQHKHFDNYGTNLNSNAAWIPWFWSSNYRAINTCNIGIERIPGITASSGIFSTDAGKASRIAELRFLRALYHMQLVQQFGSVPLMLKSSVGVQTYFPRNTVAEIYASIIADFRHAESVLPLTQSDRGRATKGTAAHFLAKAYLSRASAVVENRGKKSTDLDSAIVYSEQVINSGTYTLVPDFKNLWLMSNEANAEVIFAAQNNNNLLLQNNDLSNEVHLFFGFPYDNEKGMTRDIANGRPWRRLRMTNHATDVFDRKNDSRFYKSLKTVWFCNNTANIPLWPADHWDPAKAGKKKYNNIGDTSIVYTLHKYIPASMKAEIPADFAPKGAGNAYDTADYLKPYLWFYRNHEGTDELSYTDQRFLVLLKHLDPTRLTVATEWSARDGWLARLAETYLIAAEAHGRNGNYVQATTYINILRNRAAYKAGEVKPFQFYFGEGGAKGDISATYDLIKLPEDGSYWNSDISFEQYPPSAGSVESRFIHFILNERTRELLGELYRWEDLQRTETLVERTELFNTRAAVNIQEHHKLRPIPQSHIDAITNADGSPLSEEERAQEQNDGY